MRGAGRAGAECVRRRLRARTRGEDGHYKVEAEYVVLPQLVEGQAPGAQHVVRQVVQARLHLRRRRGGARLRDAARPLEAKISATRFWGRKSRQRDFRADVLCRLQSAVPVSACAKRISRAHFEIGIDPSISRQTSSEQEGWKSFLDSRYK